jgi:tight adherence protein B
MPLGLLVIIVFFVGAGAVVGVYLLLASRPDAALRRTVEGRLQQIGGAPEAPAGSADSLFRTATTGPVPLIDRVAKHAVKGLAVERWVEQSGLKLTISGLFMIALGLGVLCAMIAMGIDHHWWSAVGGFVAGVAMPFAFVKSRRTARMNKFEEQFPEALDLMARSIRAGHAFGAGLKMVSDELHDPVGPEFRKSFEEQNFGLSMKESLNNLAMRVPLLDVRFFATAVLIQRETGGNLAETLENLETILRKRQQMRLKIKAMSSEATASALIIGSLPFVMATLMSFVSPAYLSTLFTDPLGRLMLAGGGGSLLVGVVIMRQMVRFEI